MRVNNCFDYDYDYEHDDEHEHDYMHEHGHGMSIFEQARAGHGPWSMVHRPWSMVGLRVTGQPSPVSRRLRARARARARVRVRAQFYSNLSSGLRIPQLTNSTHNVKIARC